MIKAIDILGFKFAIILNEDIVRRGREGECDIEREAITLNPKLTKRGMADTLLHEILHAINEIGLNDENKLTELQITYLGAVLSEVFGRNPKLMECF